MRGGEPVERAAGRRGRGADLVETLPVPLRLHDVGHPAVTVTARARQRGVRAAADPDRRAGLLHGLGIERHAGELREAPLERRRAVAPQRAHDVDRLADACATLGVRHAADLELLGILAAHADAEDEAPAGEHVERGRDLCRDRRLPQSEQIDGGAETQTAGDRHVRREQRERLVHRIVEGNVIAGEHGVEPERLDAAHEIELLLWRLEGELNAEAQRGRAHRGNPALAIVDRLAFPFESTVTAA